ncbi:hypothetical protein Nepgr_010084 [Nepenthes gracilis]|uniref:YTH domain-containing family protein n=1 Tax=Nepenthes gracilis TaxID=150966 RepID=A0AAD3SCA4_NEPGR|nr:hypothetical protein Nepgr_010084 [Nepenthes gracilis]
MAAVAAAPSDKTADLLQKLSLDSQTKTLEVHDSTKQFGSVGSRNWLNGLGTPFERSTTPIQDFTNLSTYYALHGYPSAAYYYGGYDGPHQWNDYRYVNHDMAKAQHVAHQRSLTSGMGHNAGFIGRMQPSDQILGQFGNAYSPNLGFGLNYCNSKASWQAIGSKYTPKGIGNGFSRYGNENSYHLNELSKGPRSTGLNNPLGFAPIKLSMKGQDPKSKANNKEENLSQIPDRDRYNGVDFPENYTDAKFFVIKSYSEDDVHKSIKYNVWASTPNGNKKLDAAYQEAQGKTGGCPVFLLFSVNTSGQFVGLAEMIDRVDFNRTMDFWQQDKWTGCIPIKWHIIKDVPNSLLKHIKLDNNDNKPVTNSRDTQEVKLEQGIQLLKILKLHSSKTCILDDFEFYETRERAMQEKKAKRLQFYKQAKDNSNTPDQKLPDSLDIQATLTDKPAAALSSSKETKLENGLAARAAADIAKVPKAAEKHAATNGAATVLC